MGFKLGFDPGIKPYTGAQTKKVKRNPEGVEALSGSHPVPTERPLNITAPGRLEKPSRCAILSIFKSEAHGPGSLSISQALQLLPGTEHPAP